MTDLLYHCIAQNLTILPKYATPQSFYLLFFPCPFTFLQNRQIFAEGWMTCFVWQDARSAKTRAQQADKPAVGTRREDQWWRSLTSRICCDCSLKTGLKVDTPPLPSRSLWKLNNKKDADVPQMCRWSGCKGIFWIIHPTQLTKHVVERGERGGPSQNVSPWRVFWAPAKGQRSRHGHIP